MIDDVIIDDVLEVHDGAFSTIEIRIAAPYMHGPRNVPPIPNIETSCVYEIVAGQWRESHRIIGGGSLQAMLLTLGFVADRIRDLMNKHGGRIDDVRGERLQRLAVTDADSEAAARYRFDANED